MSQLAKTVVVVEIPASTDESQAIKQMNTEAASIPTVRIKMTPIATEATPIAQSTNVAKRTSIINLSALMFGLEAATETMLLRNYVVQFLNVSTARS